MASLSTAPGPIERVGALVLDGIGELGNGAIFAGRMFAWMCTRLPRRAAMVPILYQIGVGSVPVVAITGTFLGMVLAVQGYSSFSAMHMETRLGSIINISLVRELGPVLAATMLAGRVGSAMAAELGTMRVTEQIDALASMGTDPIYYLVVPRFLACFLLIPLLTVMSDFMGILGGALISTKMLGIDPFHYWAHSRHYVGLWDVFSGVFKSVWFGSAIAIVSCHRGFHSRAGAEGVGQAATEAFVYSFVAILIIDFFLGTFLSTLYKQLWPESSGSLFSSIGPFVTFWLMS